MNKETYKEYVRQRLNEEKLTRKEFKARKKAAKAQMVTGAAINMGISNEPVAAMEPDYELMEPDELMDPDTEISPKFKYNLAVVFHNIQSARDNALHQEQTKFKSQLPFTPFHKLPEEQQKNYHTTVEAAIDTINKHPPGGFDDDETFEEKMFPHFTSLLGIANGEGKRSPTEQEHQGEIHRQQLVHAIRLLKPNLSDQ